MTWFPAAPAAHGRWARVAPPGGVLRFGSRALIVGGGLLLVSLASAYAVLRFELATLVAAVYALLVLWVLARPRSCALFMLAVTIAIEPHPIDWTQPFASIWHRFPPAMAAAMPVKTSPLEVMLVLLAISLAWRGNARPAGWLKVPLLVWAVPIVVALGMAYGLARGGQTHLVYHEARGLLFAAVAFFVTLRLRDVTPRTILKVLFPATTALAVIVILRYFALGRDGQELPISRSFLFAHEDVLMLGIGLALSSTLFLRGRTNTERALLALHALLMIAAIMATGRRSGTLVLIVTGAVALWLLFGRRPVLAIIVLILGVSFGSVYLGAYWNKDHGALAQPARAIRSQFAPSERDRSSDDYRDIERFNVIQTIHATPAFGVGFGRPFFSYRPLPDVGRSGWELQLYTPHDNLLWLWLKMGFAGISVMFGVWLLACSRTLRALREAPGRSLPVVPLLLTVILATHLIYSTVDIALLSVRPILPAAIAIALALTLPDPVRRNASQR